MKSKLNLIIYITLVSIPVLIYLGFVIHDYSIAQCQNKFGVSYNKKRKELGIPLIPNHWNIKERSKEYIGWSGDENKIGHKRKAVIFSSCDIEAELDVFRLPLQNGEERLLEVKYNYPKEDKNPKIIYTYQVGHYANPISRTTADSILKAENIKR